MLRLTKLTPAYINELRALSVYKYQKQFVGTISDSLAVISDTVQMHLILSGETVIGSFLLDSKYPGDKKSETANSLGVCAFMIGAQFQGKGFGSSAVRMLRPYVMEHYPEHTELFTDVSCRNEAAYQCYLSGGFVATKKTFFDGTYEELLRIMKMKIR